MCVFFSTLQWECCGAFGADDWNLNIYFNCTDSNPSREKCGVPFSCCTKDPGVCPPPFIDRYGLLCLSLWSVFIGEEGLISLSVTDTFGYLHPAEGRRRLDSNRTSRPQRLAVSRIRNVQGHTAVVRSYTQDKHPQVCGYNQNVCALKMHFKKIILSKLILDL